MTAIMSIMVILVASLGIGLMAQDSYAQDPKYIVKVTFDSITVHNDHDGLLKGAGEWYNLAYVQGKKVVLQMAPDSGDTIKLGKEITVQLKGTAPLSIFTYGWESDFQFGFSHGILLPDDINIAGALPIFDDPGLDWSSGIDNYVRDQLEIVDEWDTDRLGRIKEFYDPTEYGAGPHQVKSHTGDFTLKYTISASPTFLSQIPLGDIPKLGLGLTCNNNLPISSATSSGNLATFPPSNAIDNNPNTVWWSTLIVDPYITLDLGTSKSVCGVDIAYADGASHPYRFDVSVSTDGTTFTNVLSGTSTGTTTSPEKYNFPPAQVRYVKITITESTAGIQTSIARISEIDVFG